MVNENADMLSFNLRDIAQWNRPNALVSVPSLQRGLVWRPKQIELLWDSLMRGIPIGSFVICKAIDEQRKTSDDKAQYQLLDGQQRANAIALGFNDWNSIEKDSKQSILWLDLDTNPENIPSDSSRNFLFRVTTPAHPWGYTKNDAEGYLGAAKIRTFLKDKLDLDTSSLKYKRPLPCELAPIDATCPVPVSLLISSMNSNGELDKNLLLDNLNNLSKCKCIWTENAKEAICEQKFDLSLISEGLRTALNSTILAINTPAKLLEPSRLENQSDNSRSNITNIEHLFQRLNQQGTRLDGEELIYSLIKAYWPEITTSIDRIAQNRMACSRLINLAFRLILTENSGTFSAPLSISTIRRLAKDTEKEELREEIIAFINEKLDTVCQTVDAILGMKPQSSWGLPPVLYSEIAHQHQDLYLTVMLTAKKYQELPEDFCRTLTGLITYAAWFGNDQRTIASILYKNLNQQVSIEALQKTVKECSHCFARLHQPDEAAAFIALPSSDQPDQIKSWNWWKDLIADSDAAKQQENESQWWGMLCTMRQNKSLLLYAQREFIRKRFSSYDPSRKDLWLEHNRPWDYDHILPAAYTYNIKTNNEFAGFCKQWCNTIGNFRAWPYEDNRSDQAEMAGKKLNQTKLLEDSFISDDELKGFNHDRDILSGAGSALAFADACKSRIIRIYREWFDALNLKDIL